MTPTAKDPPQSNFVGAVFPKKPLCIDRGRFCSMSNSERGVSAIPRQTSRASECCLAVMNPTKSGDECKNYMLHFFLHQDRHPAVFEVTHDKTPPTAPPAKPTEEKTRTRAGATPLCAAFSRPKCRGVAPACPEPLGAVFFPPPEEKQEFCQTPGLAVCKQKGENNCPF